MRGEGKAADGRGPRVSDRLAVVVSIAVLLFCFATLLQFRYGRDQGIFQVVADAILRGEAPYLDAWDFKPPGIYFVYAAAQVFGSSETAIRILEAICLTSVILAACIFTRRHLGSRLAGLFGATFAIITHVQLEYWHTAQPETFAAVPLMWALVCVTWEPRAGDPRGASKRSAAWAGAGTLFGVAFLMKPHLGGGILFSWALLLRPWPCDRAEVSPFVRRAFGPTLALFGGAAAPIALTLAYFAAHGALGSMYDALFVFTPQYAALGAQQVSVPTLLYAAIDEVVSGFSGVTLFGLALVLALPPVSKGERTALLHLGGALVFPVAGAALQAKFFPYHFGTALIVVQIIAGIGVYKGWTIARRHPAFAVAFLLLLGAMVESRAATRTGGTFGARTALRLEWLRATDERRREIDDQLYATSDFASGPNREAALWLRENTPVDAAVFIWGFEPNVYLESDRRLASRYLYNLPQRVEWAWREHRPILLGDLERRPPAAILVEQKDRMPWVTGDSMDSAEALSTFPELEALIDRDYEMKARNARFFFFLRTPPTARVPTSR